MSVTALDMRVLLEQAGFRLRGERRADCAHCQGASQGTVSFTDEVAFCHRCQWRANRLTLARDLGVLRANRRDLSELQYQARHWARLDNEIKRFESWRQAHIREVSDSFLTLSRLAARASEVLTTFRDCEPAWDALARFYHSEMRLSATFDWLTFAKAGAWLEVDSTPAEVFEAWRRYAG